MKTRELLGQISIFHPATAREPDPLPCDSCAFDIKNCCNYPDSEGNYCVRGDKREPRKEIFT